MNKANSCGWRFTNKPGEASRLFADTEYRPWFCSNDGPTFWMMYMETGSQNPKFCPGCGTEQTRKR